MLRIALAPALMFAGLIAICLAVRIHQAKAYHAGRRDLVAGTIDRRRSGAYLRGVVDEAFSALNRRGGVR
jgi:hypothetical protein